MYHIIICTMISINVRTISLGIRVIYIFVIQFIKVYRLSVFINVTYIIIN